MNCSKCGAFNNESAKFCISCGNSLVNVQTPNNFVESTEVQQAPINQEVVENNSYQQPLNNQMSSNNVYIGNNIQNPSTTTNQNPFNYFAYLIAAILKPFQAFSEEEEKLNDLKTSAILSGIVAGIMMLVTFIKTVISSIVVKTYDFSTASYKTKLVFENLKKLDYIDLIGKNLLIFAGIILGIAVIYYLAGLVMKKNIVFQKMLSISATAMLPFVALSLIVSPLLGLIWHYLEAIAFIIGIIYSVVILVTLMKKQISFEKEDMNIYFHTVCLSIPLFIGYCIFMKYIQTLVSTGLGNIFGK